MSKFKLILLHIAIILFITAAFLTMLRFRLIPGITYSAEDFGIETVYSTVDFNQNGTDDYTDLLLGAKADAENHPAYDDAYYAGGYPPDDIGVCTDVIWRAFRQAGYSLRDMVDNDIVNRPKAYRIDTRDKNIDFRRVRNLRVFLEGHAVVLTNDINDLEQWQPGDIVIFEDNKHIGIVSDLRNRHGQPYIIHNGGQLDREENYLPYSEVTGHYRFDAAFVEPALLVPWHE